MDTIPPEACETILTKLGALNGHTGSLIVSLDGEVLASRLGPDRSLDEISVTAAEMVGLCSRAASEFEFGHADIMVIEGEQGRIAAVNAPLDLGFIILVGDPEMNLALARIQLNKAVSEIEAGLAS